MQIQTHFLFDLQVIAEIAQATNKDPYEDPEFQQRLLSDYNDITQKMTDEKYCNELWKRLNSLQQQADTCKQTISVAR